MLKVTGLDHLNINVKNLKETVSWYQDLFGFEVKEEGVSSDDAPWGIIGLDSIIYLCLYETKNDFGSDKRLSHIGLHVENFSEVLSTLKEKNIRIEYGEEVNYGKSKSIYILDPNGLEIEISEVFGGGLN